MEWMTLEEGTVWYKSMVEVLEKFMTCKASNKSKLRSQGVTNGL